MSLNPPEPFGGGIKSKTVTLSLSGDVYLLKVGSLSFGSPVSASTVSKPIFDINATKENTNISTPILSVSGKTSYPLVLWMQAPHQKSALFCSLLIPEQVDQEV